MSLEEGFERRAKRDKNFPSEAAAFLSRDLMKAFLIGRTEGGGLLHNHLLLAAAGTGPDAQNPASDRLTCKRSRGQQQRYLIALVGSVSRHVRMGIVPEGVLQVEDSLMKAGFGRISLWDNVYYASYVCGIAMADIGNARK